MSYRDSDLADRMLFFIQPKTAFYKLPSPQIWSRYPALILSPIYTGVRAPTYKRIFLKKKPATIPHHDSLKQAPRIKGQVGKS